MEAFYGKLWENIDFLLSFDIIGVCSNGKSFFV